MIILSEEASIEIFRLLFPERASYQYSDICNEFVDEIESEFNKYIKDLEKLKDEQKKRKE